MKEQAFSASKVVSKAFTLIELLIVVAIIAILAAIAVPNFLEAQTRSKVSRVRADHRTIVTGLELYQLDNNKYPNTPFTDVGVIRVVPNLLSTPIAYITTVSIIDPFLGPNVGDFEVPGPKGANGEATVNPWLPCPPGSPCITANGVSLEPQDSEAGKRYFYTANIDGRRTAGVQADLLEFSVPTQGAWVVTSLGPDRGRDLIFGPNVYGPADTYLPYDATNGTISEGDIVRTQKESEGSVRQ